MAPRTRGTTGGAAHAAKIVGARNLTNRRRPAGPQLHHGTRGETMNTLPGNPCHHGLGADEHDLERLYSQAIGLYEHAQSIVQQLIDAIQDNSELDNAAKSLRSTCDRIAQVDVQIAALRHQSMGPDGSSDQPPWDTATRHLTALGQLCDKVRAA